ncbi:MAG: Rieske 2Fe-2S domain-containing protein [Rhodospirillales bacterium]|nr:Rieske 2Fe-2S domain-containing protein [Rhodospirillales bacterium]
MGEFMRQYWLPAGLSSELEADGDPMRLMLLGEKLIAFRDSSGRIGIMDHRCPHRCASFFFGRNEEDGIRCVYHGWKFDVDGNCVDMANVPPHQDFKAKVKAKSYKATERNGLIWVYMGDQTDIPELPDIEANLQPEAEVDFRFVQRRCNWLQALEGDLDTSHLSFLHFGSVGKDALNEESTQRHLLANRAPEFIVQDTDYGTMGAAFRPADEDNTYWRFAHYIFPVWAFSPNWPMDVNILARAWVPMDDEHTMFMEIIRKNVRSAYKAKDGKQLAGAMVMDRLRPNSTDWFGRWRLSDDTENDYGIDRGVQKTGSYTGIDGIHLQDQATTESMGPISDKTWEHLSPTDTLITATRKRIINAVNAYKKDGALPPKSRLAKTVHGVRSGSFTAPKHVTWLDAYEQQMATGAKNKAQAAG